MEKKIRLKELGNFLKNKRKNLKISEFGIEKTSSRKTSGLRREEVAYFSGISLTLYTWLEQGRDIGVSDDVLKSLCRIFKLTESEKKYIYLLAQKHLTTIIPYDTKYLDKSYQLLLDNFKTFPAYILDNYWNVIAWNESAKEIFGDFSKMSNENRNNLWRVFTDEYTKLLLDDWESAAKKLIAMYRISSVNFNTEEWYEPFLKKLKERSREFSEWWESYDVREIKNDEKVLNHPKYGKLYLQHNTFAVTEYQGYLLTVYVPFDIEETALKLETVLKKK